MSIFRLSMNLNITDEHSYFILTQWPVSKLRYSICSGIYTSYTLCEVMFTYSNYEY